MRIDRAAVKDLALAGALLGLFALVVYLPAKLEGSRLSQRLDKAESALEQELAQVALLPTVRGQVARLEQELASAERVVPAEDETDRLVRRLSEALRSQGLETEELVTDPPRVDDGYEAVRVRMRFEGSFVAAYGLLEQIEAQPRLLRVERLEIDAAEGGSSRLRVTLELTAFTARMEEVSR